MIDLPANDSKLPAPETTVPFQDNTEFLGEMNGNSVPQNTGAPNSVQQNQNPQTQNQQPPEVSDDVKNALKDLLDLARREDQEVRWEFLRVWKRLEYYWENILDIFMDPATRDWRIPNWDQLESEMPSRLINIYRPHGEAIVAALSVDVPSQIYHPDDADNPDDIETARAYRSITNLLALHNNAPVLFIRALVIAFNQGTIFAYNYYHTDPKFGTYPKPRIQNSSVNTFQANCAQCGSPLDAGAQGQQQGAYNCPDCGYKGPASISEGTESIPQIVGWDHTPKGTVCQEVFSGLNVKVPAYVRKQDECGYIDLEFNQSTAMLRAIYQKAAIREKIDSDYEDRFFKLPLQYLNEVPDNASSVACIWFRPWFFWSLNEAKATLLTQAFPDGCYAVFINDEFMEAYPENMDEHWTISPNPLGKFIYARPMGENLATVQDIRADLVEIELQTAEYGIPETFADPGVLDFKKYGKGRAQPGMMTEAKPRGGKSLNDAFYATKAATLSQEIDPLRQHIDQDAQFVVGSFPSVYGGPATGGSKTASEYSQSRSIALQRLGSVWKMMCIFWSEFQSRSAVEFATELQKTGQDEKFTQREDNNNFINIWIRNSSLSGKVGRVEPESSEQLPTSWAQKKDTIMMLLQQAAAIPQVMETLMHPRNSTFMKEAVGLKDLYIPGEEDRIRQYKEFQMLAQGIPVPIDPMADNSEVHIEVLKGILEGIAGEALSPEAKQACAQHLQEHMMIAQQNAMQAQAEQGGNEPPNNNDNKKAVQK
jgi:predicted RNA-binding Zn-ribbon protein involved in translation (DUF1610 family)